MRVERRGRNESRLITRIGRREEKRGRKERRKATSQGRKCR